MLGTSAYPFYLIKGRQESAIIEGGIGAQGPLMVRQLEQQGVAAGEVRQLVITHAHPDHVMAVPLLRRKYSEVKVLGLASRGRCPGLRQSPRLLSADGRRLDVLPGALRRP